MKCDKAIRTLSVMLIIGTLGVCGCGTRYKKVGAIGEEGDLKATYKIPLGQSRLRNVRFMLRAAGGPEGGKSRFTPEGYPESVGSSLEAVRGGDAIMRLARKDGEHYEITFHAPITHALESTDGLLKGDVRRTIQPGVRLLVGVDGWDIISIEGPEDQYEVLSAEAKVNLGGRSRTRKQGIYKASEFL